MPTLIKGIISSVTDPLLTLTATGANDQGSALTLWKNIFFSSPLWHPSLFQLIQPPISINSNQCQSIHSVAAFTHPLLPPCHMISPQQQHGRSVLVRGSGTRLTGADVPVPPCAGSRHRHGTPGRAAGGGLTVQLALLFCSNSPLADVLLVSGTDGNYHADPSGPASALWDPVVIGAGGLWSLLSSRRFMRFSLGLQRPRQRANCGVVARANRTPHVSAFVGGQWPNS